MRAELEKLAELEEDWDSYGAHPISQDALDRAERLLDTIDALGIQRPAVVPLSDSGIELEWAKPAMLISITPNAAATIWWEGED